MTVSSHLDHSIEEITSTETSQSSSPLPTQGYATLAEKAAVLYRDQSLHENKKIFEELLETVQSEIEFLPILEFLYSTHFRGSYQCLNLSIQRLENRYPQLMRDFRESYTFPGDEYVPNIQGVTRLVQKKIETISSLTSVVDEDHLYTFIEYRIRRETIKAAFVVADTGISPPHYYSVGMEQIAGTIHLFLGESAKADRYLHLSNLKMIASKLSKRFDCNIPIYYYKYARQKDFHTCPYFAINDSVQFLREQHFFRSLPAPLLKYKTEFIEADEIPPGLMKYTQFSPHKDYHKSHYSLSRNSPSGAHRVGRYLTEAGDNQHALIKEKRALCYLLKLFIQERFT